MPLHEELKVGKGRGYLNDQFIRDGTYKQINGQWHKKCKGPAHPEGVYLPWNEKYYYLYKKGARAGTFTSQCRLCHQWHKVKSPGTDHGLVPISQIRHFYIEGVNRVGMTELAKRAGVTAEHIKLVISGKQKYVRKATLKKIMLELVSIKRHNEYSINAYALWRVRKRGYEPGTQFCVMCHRPYKNSDGYIEMPKNDDTHCDRCSEREYKRAHRASGQAS
jgi:DNA-binding Xre family transcriptional regulator